jgi:Tfp pilus assembly protein PilX
LNTWSGQKRGFILLFTVVIISVTVGLSVSLLISSTRQSQLGSLQSEIQSAFYAADTGMECGLAYVYPDTTPTFSCAGMKPEDKNGTTDIDVYYFDYRSAMPVASSTWGTNVNWSTVTYGGDTASCGVVVIKKNDSWLQKDINGVSSTQQGYTIESYGYSICTPDSADGGALKPSASDPNLIERKILIHVPVYTV